MACISKLLFGNNATNHPLMNFHALPTLISNDLTALSRALRQAHPFSYELLMMATIVVVTS